jgi:metallo-beta-lactamase class B
MIGLLRAAAVAVVFLVATTLTRGQQPTSSCRDCAEWNAPQAPFRIFGNTYYVGPRGLSVILITSGDGHVLLDGALPESATGIASNVRASGFNVEDIRLIVNSHVHFDHAGAIAQLQRISGASVAATAWSASVLTKGAVPPSDPQFGLIPPIASVGDVRTVRDRETLRIGNVAITAHETPGHTPGGTSWTWRSCEGSRCVDFVYADSLTAVSADKFLFTRSREYPNALADFERSFTRLSSVACGILITPHPAASGFWERVDRRQSTGSVDAMIDADACARYVDVARGRLKQRVKLEEDGGSSR